MKILLGFVFFILESGNTLFHKIEQMWQYMNKEGWFIDREDPKKGERQRKSEKKKQRVIQSFQSYFS